MSLATKVRGLKQAFEFQIPLAHVATTGSLAQSVMSFLIGTGWPVNLSFS